MSAAASADSGFIPAFPERYERRLPLIRLIRTLRENSIGTRTREAFERDIIVYRIGFRPVVVATHPDHIRPVILAHAASSDRVPVGKRLQVGSVGLVGRV